MIATHPFDKRRLGLIPIGSRHGWPADPGRGGRSEAALESDLVKLTALPDVGAAA